MFLDAVTTGYNPGKNSIYRLGGIIEIDGKEECRFEFKMKPWNDGAISSASLWITGETRTRIMSFPNQGETFNSFLGLVSKYVNMYDISDKMSIAGFNAAQIELPFIRAWFLRNGNTRFADFFNLQAIDLGGIAAFALADERRKMKNFHLDTVAEKVGLVKRMSEKFTCLDDARTGLEMYHAFRRKFGIGNEETPEEIEDAKMIRNFD